MFGGQVQGVGRNVGLPAAGCASPVLAFGSNRGALEEETATRMQCPLLNTSDVLHRSTFNSYTWSGSRNVSFSNDWW